MKKINLAYKDIFRRRKFELTFYMEYIFIATFNYNCIKKTIKNWS